MRRNSRPHAGPRAVAGAAAALAIFVATPPAAPAALAAAPPNGTYAYVVTRAGQKQGDSSVTVRRDSVSLALHEVELLADAPSQITVDETVDPVDLTPTSYAASFPLNNDVTVTTHLAFDPGGAHLTVDGTAGVTDFRLEQGTSRQVVVDGALMSGFLLLPSQVKAQGFASVTVLSPANARSDVFQVDASTAMAKPAGVPSPDVAVSVSGPVRFVEWYDPQTMIVDEVDVPLQQVVITRTRS